MFNSYSWIISGKFVRLWLGMIASYTANWLFYFSLIWWSINTTNNAIQGGVLIGIGIAISILVSPLSGWLADRFHRGKVMTICNLVTALVFVAISMLEFFNSVPIWLMYFIRGFISLAQAPTNPAFRSLLPEIAGKERLEKAIAFQNTLLETVLIIAPVLTGIMITFISFELLWMGCGLLSILASILNWLVLDSRGNQPDVKINRNSLGSGFQHLLKNQSLLLLTISSGIQQLMFCAFPLYIAIWSKKVVHGDSLIGGILQTTWSSGVIITSFLFTFFADAERLKKLIPVLILLLGVLIGPIGWISNICVAVSLLLLAGATGSIINIYLDGFLQRLSEGKDRGRILAAFMAINSSLIPIGYVLGGILSELLPPSWLFILLVLPIPLTAWCIWKAIKLQANRPEGEKRNEAV